MLCYVILLINLNLILIYSVSTKTYCTITKLKFTEPEAGVYITGISYTGYYYFTCVHAASRYCFARVCVCPQNNLENYWSEIDVTWQEYEPWWMQKVVRNLRHLTLTLRVIFIIFQLTLYLSIGFTQQFHFWYFDTSAEYLGHSSVGHGSKVKVTSTQKLQVENCCGLIRISVTITLDVIRSFDILTLRHIFVLFPIQAQSFECLKLATSFSVWRYIFGISWSVLSFKVMGLIWSQGHVAIQRPHVGLCSSQTQLMLVLCLWCGRKGYGLRS